jgi:hypothetical protein
MIGKFFFNRGQRGKREISGKDYGPLLKATLNHFAISPEPSEALINCVRRGRCTQEKIRDDMLAFFAWGGKWSEEGNHLRMQLEEIRPNPRLSKVHHEAVVLARAKLRYLDQWARVLGVLDTEGHEKAQRLREREIYPLDNILDKVHGNLKKEVNAVLLGSSALLHAMNLDDKLLEYLGVDPNEPHMVLYRESQ